MSPTRRSRAIGSWAGSTRIPAPIPRAASSDSPRIRLDCRPSAGEYWFGDDEQLRRCGMHQFGDEPIAQAIEAFERRLAIRTMLGMQGDLLQLRRRQISNGKRLQFAIDGARHNVS